ncbi:MAG TPA: 16S rRNA (adenine(1518)-N(6)/adenine(1519)-N(6))-dimethyltransferase RsmA [Nevskiaceae bacterium]|nr:16S rRNA (adenine(1518)-N(6)/adenine(1519)-N(6))-dimethyltransferase RsmA [Nevskiaceae bacterium]
MSGGPQAKKRFGQHFLHDPGVIERILRAVDPQPGEALVEIGPGPGALTAPLLRRWPGVLTVVELDREVLPWLREACGEQAERLQVIEADALQLDYRRLAPEGQPLRLIGNLPYNISTPLLFHLLEQSPAIRDMHFMLQKEVVDRMVAAPGEAAYGRLSVAMAARAELAWLLDVGPGAFKPPPRVQSAVVRIRPRAPAFAVADWAAFDRVLAQAFSQRRKTLSNALRGLLDATRIEQAGVDPGARAETLDAAAYARLAAQIAV